MRRLVMHHHTKGFVLIPLPQPVEREIGNQIGDVPFAHRLFTHFNHNGIMIQSLAGQHIPVIETSWIMDAAMPQMPFPDNSRLVALLLHELGIGK